MSRVLRICILATWLPFAATLMAADKAVTYDVQLIRCSAQEQAPEPGQPPRRAKTGRALSMCV